MDTFPITHFRFSTRYPNSGQRIQLGNSYQFDTPPLAPDQRIFSLKIPGLAYFLTPEGAISLTTLPWRNMAVLEAFYNEHKMAFPFHFPHPVYGTVTCKFNSPLVIPDGEIDGRGLLQTVEVELIEIP